jgi:hypothetical protein
MAEKLKQDVYASLKKQKTVGAFTLDNVFALFNHNRLDAKAKQGIKEVLGLSAKKSKASTAVSNPKVQVKAPVLRKTNNPVKSTQSREQFLNTVYDKLFSIKYGEAFDAGKLGYSGKMDAISKTCATYLGLLYDTADGGKAAGVQEMLNKIPLDL